MGLLDLVSDNTSPEDAEQSNAKNNPILSDSIDVTEAALQQIRNLKKDEGHSDHYALRLGVKGGGCSGLSYDLKFSEQKEKDRIIEHEDVKIVVDPKSFIYLKGIQLDFEGGLKGKGFIFQNPNASNTCGCGESFSV